MNRRTGYDLGADMWGRAASERRPDDANRSPEAAQYGMGARAVAAPLLKSFEMDGLEIQINASNSKNSKN